MNKKLSTLWDFPGGPVVKTSPTSAGSVGSFGELRSHMPCGQKTPQKPKHKTEAIL